MAKPAILFRTKRRTPLPPSGSPDEAGRAANIRDLSPSPMNRNAAVSGRDSRAPGKTPDIHNAPAARRRFRGTGVGDGVIALAQPTAERSQKFSFWFPGIRRAGRAANIRDLSPSPMNRNAAVSGRDSRAPGKTPDIHNAPAARRRFRGTGDGNCRNMMGCGAEPPRRAVGICHFGAACHTTRSPARRGTMARQAFRARCWGAPQATRRTTCLP